MKAKLLLNLTDSQLDAVYFAIPHNSTLVSVEPAFIPEIGLGWQVTYTRPASPTFRQRPSIKVTVPLIFLEGDDDGK